MSLIVDILFLCSMGRHEWNRALEHDHHFSYMPRQLAYNTVSLSLRTSIDRDPFINANF